MKITDYLIDQAGIDWSAVMADWSWLVPDQFTLWMVNRYGDCILELRDGSISFLDVGVGSLASIAASKEDFYAKVDEGDNAPNWFLIPLVDRCVAAGLILGEGQCYGYKVPPILGGKYDVENTDRTSVVVSLGLLAQIASQAKDLPDGTRIKVVAGT